MPSFSYKAVNDTGQLVNGVLTAENYQVALRMLEEQPLFPVKSRRVHKPARCHFLDVAAEDST